MDLPFLFNRYVRNRKVSEDGLLWTFPDKNMLIYHQEDFLNDIILKKSDGCFLDVGANVGAWAIRASPYYDVVVAFEPSPRIFNALDRNVRMNKRDNILTYNLAIGNQNGPGLAATHVTNHEELETVDYRKLDDFPFTSTFTTMLIDTEGAGYQVTQGAIGFIARNQPTIIVEVHTIQEKAIPELIPGNYSWEKRYRPLPIAEEWFYRENGNQLFLIGKVNQ